MPYRGFSGVYAALVTPFGADGNPDLGVVRTLTRYLVNAGLAGVCPVGTTGEFPALSAEEKAAVNRAACEAAGEEGAVIAGVWGASAAERAFLVRDAEAHGAAAVFLTTPIFYPATPASLLAWYRGVKRLARLPVFGYNIPQFTTNEIPLPVLDTLVAEGTLAGYKDSSHEAARLAAAAGLLRGRVPVFAGSEGLFPAARTLGVDGFISGLASVFPRTVLGVWRGDAGAAEKLAAAKEAVRKHGGIAALKHLLVGRGFAVGAGRDLLAPPTPEDASALEALASID